jgi:Dihydrofolate reductase
MKAILSVDKNWGIGFENQLLERVPEDMRFFKDMTIGKVVVMGRRTFDSLPGRKPLRDRINIVLSGSLDKGISGITVCNSMAELFDEIEKKGDKEIYIIGGAEVYKQLLPYCSEVYITKFNNAYKADRYFPDLDKDKDWSSYILNGHMFWNNLEYSRVVYKNKNVKINSKKDQLFVRGE